MAMGQKALTAGELDLLEEALTKVRAMDSLWSSRIERLIFSLKESWTERDKAKFRLGELEMRLTELIYKWDREAERAPTEDQDLEGMSGKEIAQYGLEWFRGAILRDVVESLRGVGK
jgi:hypothetical protein